MNRNLLFAILLVLSTAQLALAQSYELLSPDKNIKITIQNNEQLTYSVLADGQEILAASPISMTVNDNLVLGKNANVKKTEKKSVDETITPVVAIKRNVVRNNYNELVVQFKGNYGVAFRAFNDGVAYRFITSMKENLKVNSEEARFNFAGDYNIYFPEEEGFQSHNERLYAYLSLKEINEKRFCSTPALVDTKSNMKIAISESDLYDYAGMWLKGTGANSLQALFPGVALEVSLKRDRDEIVTKHADYIAQTVGTRSFPWRVMAITRSDAELISNQLVFLLGRPSAEGADFSWVKPGKVAWDWWNFNNIYNVDFRAGVNTETYKYYIDFASKNGLEYVILDEGWYKLGDLLTLEKDIDMDEIMAYANSKNVGIILWVVWKTLDEQLEPAMKLFDKWGIKGIKVDFMQRDDQWMVNYYWRIAEACAKHKLLVDFHGAYKPSGMYRTFPNFISNEGVKGMENCKWSADITPEHDVTLPFIRMWAGPMDFTPGAMINATKSDFKDVFNTPMSQGTRCHQLAMYAIFESPLQMLTDNPTHYYREPECLEFLSKVPSVWDETVVLDAKVADYVAVARKHGNEWYVGAMTDWTPRELTLDFSFLEAGKTFTAVIYQDGINADRNANDYKKVTRTVIKGDKITVKLAPGGGWACRVY
jgi:alpha-glucosidase